MNIHFFTPADNEPSYSAPAAPTTPAVPRYTDADRQFLRDNYPTMSTAELATSLGRSYASVASYASKLGLKKDADTRYRLACLAHKKRDAAYSAAEIQFLRDNWQTMTTTEMAVALGRTKGSVKEKGQKALGLRKTRESIKTLSKRPNAGQFKKGNLPANTIFGDEQLIRIRRNKDRKPYKWIRVGFRQWRMYHVHLWEQANGPVPKGSMVVFRNRDQLDCWLENLELITRREHAIRNSASLNLTDGFVAHTLAWHNPDMQEEVLRHPDLIDLQRTQIQLKRAIKQHDHAKPAKTRRSRQPDGR